MIFVNSDELIKQIEFFKSLNIDQMLYLKGHILIVIDKYVFLKRNPPIVYPLVEVTKESIFNEI